MKTSFPSFGLIRLGLLIFAGLSALLAPQGMAATPNRLTFGTTTFPGTATAGATISFSYAVTNAGSNAWGANHYLALRDSNLANVAFGSLNGVAVNGTSTISIAFTAPPQAGLYTYTVQGLENGVAWFSNKATVTLLVTAPTSTQNKIRYDSTTFPSVVPPGATVGFTCKVTNTGSNTWGSSHYLVWRDASFANLVFAPLSGVAPGASIQLTGSITAPQTPGSYTYYLQGLENGAAYFDAKATVVLTVSRQTNDAISYDATTFPMVAEPGTPISFTSDVTNTGGAAWGPNHYLVLRDGNGANLAFASLSGIGAGAHTQIGFSLAAPNAAGTYTYHVQALENGVAWFARDLALVLSVPAVSNGVNFGVSTFPKNTLPGTAVNFSYEVTNTGTTTWGPNHYLALRDGNGTFLYFASIKNTAPGAKATPILRLTAPLQSGDYGYTVQAVEHGVAYFGPVMSKSLAVVATLPNAVAYGANTFPSMATPGATGTFTFTVTNKGTKAWGPDHYLVLRDANGTSLDFELVGTVAPGASATVTLHYTAPATAGTYLYYVQGLENGVEFFGTQEPLVLQVAGSAANGISFGTTTLPATASPGTTLHFTGMVTNSGTRAWGSSHYIGLKDGGGNYIGFVALNGIAPGGGTSFDLAFPAPSSSGFYSYTVQALENGVETFGPQVAAAIYVRADGLPTEIEASRFLIQATYGPTAASIANVRSVGFSSWVNEQIAMPATYHLPYYRTRVAELRARDNRDGYWGPRQEAWWQHGVTAPDQLRQRMAFALSEILVISQISKLDSDNEGVTAYYDLLVKNAFGNYRQLLDDVTMSPMMGTYLSMIRNRKPNAKTGTQPDENYAREIMQLMTIGLSRLRADGTLLRDASGATIPTYTQADVIGLAHVFTGWGPYFNAASPPRWSDGTVADAASWFQWGWDPLRPMTFNKNYGDLQDRKIVAGVTIPGSLDGPQRMKLALDTLFNHPNVGPFLARRLIQRFVTSNPSPAYIGRVAAAFGDNGSGVRGDLGATIRAVLLDPEARLAAPPDFATAKLSEPLIRLTRLFRAFPPAPAPHAATGDNRYFLNFVWDLEEQAPLLSPSVFNFYRPDFAQPGSIARAGLVSPEFQIFNDTTAISEVNRYYQLLNWGIWVSEPSGADSSSQMQLDLTEPLAVLLTPGLTHVEAQGKLLDFLSVRLLGGTMSPYLRQEILNSFTALPSNFGYGVSSETKRVRLAVYLVMFSPEFNVQH